MKPLPRSVVRTSSHSARIALAVSAVLGLSAAAKALTENNWIGTTGNFNDPTQWSLDHVPGTVAGEAATLDNGTILITDTESVPLYSVTGFHTGANGTMNITGDGSYTVGSDFNVGESNALGTLNIDTSGTIQATHIFWGIFGMGTAIVNQSAGTVIQTGTDEAMELGGFDNTSAAALGTYNLSGGSMSTQDTEIGYYGNGYLNQTGGTFTTNGWTDSGRLAGSHGSMDISGGTFTQSNVTRALLVGEDGNGVVTVRGTGTVTVDGTTNTPLGNSSGTPIAGLIIGYASDGNGMFNLDAGGTLNTTQVSGGQSTVANGKIFNFNGGTLVPSAANSSFFPNSVQPDQNGLYVMNGLTANVFSGGARIDTTNGSVTIGQPLTAPAGQGVTAIPVADGGTGYAAAPMVQITGGTGVGATAVANLDANGRITSFTITNPGTGYSPGDALSVNLNTGLSTPTTAATLGAVTLADNVSGGLTKLGENTLTLTGANTYTGATVVSGGTLEVSNDGSTVTNFGPTALSGSLSGTVSVQVNSSATLLLDGAGSSDRVMDAAHIILGGGTLAIASGSQEGVAITRSGSIHGGFAANGMGMLSLTASSTLDFDANGGGTTLVFASFDPQAFTLHITGYTNASFNGTNISGQDADDRLIFDTALTQGQLNLISFGAGFAAEQIALGDGTFEVGAVAIPEPSSLGLLGAVCWLGLSRFCGAGAAKRIGLVL